MQGMPVMRKSLSFAMHQVYILIMSYEERTYREKMLSEGLVGFNVCIKETDIYILACKDLTKTADKIARKYRADIENYIAVHKEFYTSLRPVSVYKSAPEIVKKMADAAEKCYVGPMAAVAGAVSEFVGTELLAYSDEVIVENGGDIFASVKKDMTIGVYAKDSRFNNMKIKIKHEQMPMGICTSSGMFGHSLSFGRADAAVVLCKNASLADAAATRLCNEIRTKQDINAAIRLAQSIGDIDGVLFIKDDVLGAWGNINIVQA
jgi:ApbE superfamily uncharacterized protein (UPF0280 family)